jgi:hypothetical protein
MNFDCEARTVFCHKCLDDYELRPVNHHADNLVQQLTDRDISWIGQGESYSEFISSIRS